MKREICLLMVLTLFCPPVFSNRGMKSVIDTLSKAVDYHSHASMTVQLPQGGDDVVYELEFWSTEPSPGDSLCPCRYLIDWRLESENGVSKGFTAYHDGDFYRNNDSRLQECHFRWDSIPFLMKHPVQSTAQFTDLLPQMLARELSLIATDSTWTHTLTPDTIVDGVAATVVTARQTVNDVVARNLLFVLDRQSLMPLRIERENNPGSIAEQMLIVKYADTDRSAPQGLTEDDLIRRYPVVFEKFRESNFSIESLREKQLPGFSLPTVNNKRYTRAKTDRFQVPTLLVFLDPEGDTNPRTIAEIRKARDMMPRSVDVMFAIMGSDRDGASELIGRPLPGEQILMSAQSLARNCGVTSTPSIIIVNEEGTVKDVIIGFNKALSTNVIEKTSVL